MIYGDRNDKIIKAPDGLWYCDRCAWVKEQGITPGDSDAVMNRIKEANCSIC